MTDQWRNIMSNQANAFADAFKMFGDFKSVTPAIDPNQIFAATRRNLEAASAATQVLTEGAQAIIRQQAENARDSVEEFLKVSREMLTSASPESNAARQAEYARGLFEASNNALRESIEMATKSGYEAFDILNKCATECLDEASVTTRKPSKKSAA